MKVYESTNINKRGFNKVPQIKIKNTKLLKNGFTIGSEFEVIYQRDKIVLKIIRDVENPKGE